ncbi:MAG TPA: DUF58 domain-containing protein [Pseudomonadales bacterium]|nr:DUF58 domain-containing protein [Pseudomonadales bacterium]
MSLATRYGGAYTSLEQLIALRREACPLNVTQHKKTLAAMAGSHRSSFRGRGLDFDEVRPYQAGDEVRNIDWRVTARTGSAHTKLFREEREQCVYLLVDQKSSLFFGSRHAFKSVVAAQVAAWLAWAAFANHDRVGGLIFSETAHQEFRPKAGKQGVLQFLQGLEKFNSALSRNALIEKPRLDKKAHEPFSHALQLLQRVIRPGSIVCVISDFYGLNDELEQNLVKLIRHHTVLSCLVYDPLEKNSPPAATYTLSNGEQRLRLDTHSAPLRSLYQSLYQQRIAQLRACLNPYPVPLLELSTAGDYFSQLRKQLGPLKAGRAKRHE